ncbi:MAG: 2-C-methyl-D-erythritol 4-phosphate cytidylyltransferase [Coriobacteriia bacterium]|nr:2-C-methyl-D-erythritol 4-phosphate cytidylyltransferase [Coriobacteriia bacterium]MCL2136665.1 2-C-methyl-D-erythritol 4-phosphate cytidylyltransferase [Coriobacteriia bacterium]
MTDGSPRLESSLAAQGRLADQPSSAVVIVAGGNGERFLHEGGKQLFSILGKPILTWSALAFDAVAEIGQIVIVAPEDRLDEYYQAAIAGFSFVTPVKMAPSGVIRQESSFSGISAVDDQFDFIAIHDGARPLITPDYIDHLISVLRGDLEIDGAVIGYPAIDTLKLVNDRYILGSPDRSLLWAAQTPQIFRAQIIREAHVAALAEGFVGTDDSSLVERIDGRVVIVQGPRDNIKLTVPEDAVTVQAALQSRLDLDKSTRWD